jgi:hypothetical protein
MPKVKLFGLVLIITTLILGMAVVVTETFEIRFYDPSAQATGAWQSNGNGAPAQFQNSGFPNSGFPNNNFPQSPQGGLNSNGWGDPMQNTPTSYEPQFTSVPVIIPLCVAGALGALLWFAPGPASTKKASSAKYKRSRKR